jgi:hypothetical protein
VIICLNKVDFPDAPAPNNNNLLTFESCNCSVLIACSNILSFCFSTFNAACSSADRLEEAHRPIVDNENEEDYNERMKISNEILYNIQSINKYQQFLHKNNHQKQNIQNK